MINFVFLSQLSHFYAKTACTEITKLNRHRNKSGLQSFLAPLCAINTFLVFACLLQRPGLHFHLHKGWSVWTGELYWFAVEPFLTSLFVEILSA